MVNQKMSKYKGFFIRDYDYMGSSIGNAYYSDITFQQLWDCVRLSDNREQLDEAISATILLNEIVKKEKNNHD